MISPKNLGIICITQEMGINLKSIIRAFLMICSLIITGCTQFDFQPLSPPVAIEGVIELHEWDFEKNGLVYLEGEWGFTWQELLQPDQISEVNQTHYVPVPENWSAYVVEGGSLPPDGYATYFLTLYLPDTGFADRADSDGSPSPPTN